eukprot:COSAG01_NODE_287_length_19408_cov_231.791703_23_plen_83_part_00
MAQPTSDASASAGRLDRVKQFHSSLLHMVFDVMDSNDDDGPEGQGVLDRHEVREQRVSAARPNRVDSGLSVAMPTPFDPLAR